jgi:hypothetical protein
VNFKTIFIFVSLSSLTSLANNNHDINDLLLDSKLKKIESKLETDEQKLKFESFKKSVRGITITEKTPTAYRSNGKWIVPKNGTIENLINKGFMVDTDSKHGISVKPNPFHPKYEDAVNSLKPKFKYSPSRGFTPRSKVPHLIEMGSHGDIYQLQKKYVWIKVGKNYLKLQNKVDFTEVSLHEYKDGIAISTHKISK